MRFLFLFFLWHLRWKIKFWNQSFLIRRIILSLSLFFLRFIWMLHRGDVWNIRNVDEVGESILIPAQVGIVGARHVDECSEARNNLCWHVRLAVGAPLRCWLSIFHFLTVRLRGEKNRSYFIFFHSPQLTKLTKCNPFVSTVRCIVFNR